MATQVEVVYPSTTAFTGPAQLDLGPFYVPTVATFLRAEVRGRINYEVVTYGAGAGVQENLQLWAVQWVPHGSSPANIVTTADGPNWLIREQLGTGETTAAWTPNTGSSVVLQTASIRSEWAGQLIIGAGIDLYMSVAPPTGIASANANLYASLRFWWA